MRNITIDTEVEVDLYDVLREANIDDVLAYYKKKRTDVINDGDLAAFKDDDKRRIFICKTLGLREYDFRNLDRVIEELKHLF